MEILKFGSTSKTVSYLKKKLVSLDYNLNVNEVFDENTNEAILDFQKKTEISVDGIVGGNTWTQIYLKTELPRDVTSRLNRHNNIIHLHPAIRNAVVKVYVQLQSDGIPFKIYEAYRFPERQAKLYAQGRTKAGNIVTYTKPWLSYHQYGLAVDFVLFINGEWSWDVTGEKKDWWDQMQKIGAQEGLTHLEFEIPHLQLAGTSSDALIHGRYPADGDKNWYDNIIKALEKQIII